jgi:hypothetical protein
MTAPMINAQAAMPQLPRGARACAAPITQSAPTAKKPSSMCKVIKFKAVPVQKSKPEIKASSPAKVRTAAAIRITMFVISFCRSS